MLNWLLRHYSGQKTVKKYGGYVALLSGPSGYLLFCDVVLFLGTRRGKGDSSARRAYRNIASINY